MVEASPTVVTGTNRPLREFRNVKWKADTPVSRAELGRMREAFWDTQPAYSGRQEIWQALRLACEADSTATAQAILDSTNIVVPTGLLSDGCYDELGNQYIIPAMCFVEPVNLVDEPAASAPDSASQQNLATEAGAAITARSSAHGQRPESPAVESAGSAAVQDGTSAGATIGPSVSITVRLSTGGDIKLDVAGSDTIGRVKSAILERLSTSIPTLPATKKPPRIKLLQLGRVLEDNFRVSDARLNESAVVQAFIQLQD
ncbi:hypothetical protein HK105_209248 [Polyrhizophydium stewartii]|uniref:Ubiquitin-like domain-containing protein n=1 Tax=Polyrhizophydium stewartii TaxID=2732419 RepID=A0ABR4MVJ3_9FUNG